MFARTAGLRARRLRPADPCGIESIRLCAIYGSDCFHSDRSLRRDATVTKRAFARAKLRPADGFRHRHSDMGSPVQSAAERTGVRSKRAALRQGAAAGCRTICASFRVRRRDKSNPTRRCRPPHRAADGTRRSNGVTRQDGITRSIDCSVFLFGQRHKSPSREPRYGFRLFAMIFKMSLAELYRA